MTEFFSLRRRRWLSNAAGLVVAAWAARGHAAPGGLPSNVAHDAGSAEWDTLRQRLFGGQAISVGQSVVQLVVPLRAAYGASVPVKVMHKFAQSPALYVKRLHLLVDKNPSPVAAVLDLTPRLGQADFETRLRVDEYSHIRVVSELSDGSLHTDSRYVKVSGGCSAPPNRDQLHNIGKTVLKLPAGVQPGQPTAAEVAVVHPNDTGFELNQITLIYFPPHFVRSIKLSYGGQPLFNADLDFSIAENPTLRFHFVPEAGERELRAEVEDSKDGRFSGSLAVR